VWFRLLPYFLYPFCFNSLADSFAYVDFATPEAKNAAILMSESHLEGRRLLIKDGACGALCISHSFFFVRFYDSNPCVRARPQATTLMVAL
jgi:hypothetical protein